MNKLKVLQLGIVILSTFLIGYFVGTQKISLEWKNYNPILSIANNQPPPGVNIDFANFWAVWDRVEDKYYDKTKIDPQKMLDSAVSGMLQSLDDPYTVYLPPVNNTNFKDGLAGEFQGIGAELGTKDNKIIVISPLSDSPAIRAGVKPGDTILKVNDESTQGWNLSKTVEKIRGPKGTTVALNILHNDAESPQDIKIVRDVITVKSIDGSVEKIKDMQSITLTDLLKKNEDKEVMYLRLTQFGDHTNKDWMELVNKLNLKLVGNKNFKGIVLDLRNNPGGYLTDATFIAGEFIKKGELVVIQETGTQKTTLSTERVGLFLKHPLVILINKGSASASEILSGAMRDYERAILVGETSFGKGTIQQADDLGGGAGVHITIAKWLTPKGTWVHGKGLEPDIKISLDDKNPERDTQLEKAIEELVK